MITSAKFSECGKYRYLLTREWGVGPSCVFVMLNPSKADALNDDPTIRKCVGFAKGLHCGSLWVVNLFAARATDPKDLLGIDDPVGLENHRFVMEAVDHAEQEGGVIVCAWGAHGGYMGQDETMYGWLLGYDPSLVMCLGRTKQGFPRHPLYLPYATPLERYEGRAT